MSFPATAEELSSNDLATIVASFNAHPIVDWFEQGSRKLGRQFCIMVIPVPKADASAEYYLRHLLKYLVLP